MRILFLPLEFRSWNEARALPYTEGLGLEEGLIAAGAQVCTIPFVRGSDEYGKGRDNPINNPFFIEDIGRNYAFDQVWLELCFSDYDPDVLVLLSQIAPVRIGFCLESLTYAGSIARNNPRLSERASVVEEKLKYLTHLVLWDERDMSRVEDCAQKPVFLFMPTIPGRTLNFQFRKPEIARAGFIGSVYGEREAWLRSPELSQIVVHGESAESSTQIPILFDKLHHSALPCIGDKAREGLCAVERYLVPLRKLRRVAFDLWLESLGKYQIVVNLPQYGAAYAGRVIHGMGCGRPVLTERLREHPNTMGAFVEDEEIFLYSTRREFKLKAESLLGDPERCAAVGARGRSKVASQHTTETRVTQIFEWIEKTSKSLPRETNGQRSPSQSASHGGLSEEESDFYEKLFVRTPYWSSPQPNKEEIPRWLVIKKHVDQIIGNKNGPQTRGLRVLDVGCGRGWLTNLLLEYGDTEGLEPVRAVVEYAKKLFPRIQFQCGSPETLISAGKAGTFDLIVSSEVIEHIPLKKQFDFAHNLKVLLKRGGSLIITTPRAEITDSWTRIVKPNQPIEDWLTENQVRSIFSSAGFDLIAEDRIWAKVPEMSYTITPTDEELESDDLLAVYQVKSFSSAIHTIPLTI